MFGLLAVSWCAGFSLVAVLWLLIAVASPVVECGLSSSVLAAPRLQSAGSVVVMHGVSCSEARGIFPDQGSNLCLLHWQADSLSLSHQARPRLCF